jgi:hypothetical protein
LPFLVYYNLLLQIKFDSLCQWQTCSIVDSENIN